ncbi:MAG: hypothetical protein J6I62_10050 [Selenomonadaceae bacterium]|nr:hypothetical protein [Selenomonadaceae bacterium]
MKDVDVNVLISIALGAMGIFAVITWGIISYNSGTSSGTEVPLSIASSLGGVLTGKGIAEAKFQKELQKKNNTPPLPEENIEIRG